MKQDNKVLCLEILVATR